MLRILGLMWGSLSGSGSGAGSSGKGKPRRSHGATVCEQTTLIIDPENTASNLQYLYIFVGWWSHSTNPFFEGEVRRRTPRVLAGQQPMGVPGAGCVGVGGGVGAGWTHGWRHVAVVVEHGAVAWVWGRRLRGGRVGPAQQRRGPPVDGFVRPEGRDSPQFTSTVYNQRPVRHGVCVKGW